MSTPAGWTGTPPDPVALAGLMARCVAVDGVSPLSGHVVEAVAAGVGQRYLAVSDGPELIGVAVAPGHDPAELAVDPGRRRQGIGTGLVTAVLDADSAVWAHGDLPAARALAGALGLRRTRELLQMRRSLGAELPAVEWPDGVRMRTFVPGRDEDDFLAVNARAFAWHPEQGRLDRAGLALEMAQDWFDPAGFFLAVDDDDRLLGYHWTKVHPADPAAGALGEVYVLGVDPQAPIRRLGTPLTIAGLRYLRDRGLDTVLLYVEGDNDRAWRLYERLGFSRHLSDAVYQR